MKEAIDIAKGIGGAAGEAAADLYIGYKKGRDAILNPLDKLARDIAALEAADGQVRKKKNARRDELLSSFSPEPAPLHGSAPTGSPQQGAAATAHSPAPDSGSSGAKPDAPGLGPTTPLGGAADEPPPSDPSKAKPGSPQAASQPDGGVPPKKKDASGAAPDSPDTPPAGPDAELPQAEPGTKQPGTPAPVHPGGAKGKTIKEWTALCGTSFDAVMSSVTPALVPDCLCFTALIMKVPQLSQETVVDPPRQMAECGVYIASFGKGDPKAAPPPKAKAVETAQAPEEIPQEPEQAPQKPEETQEAAAAPAPDDPPQPSEPQQDGLAPPSVPDFLKPRDPAPEPSPPPKLSNDPIPPPVSPEPLWKPEKVVPLPSGAYNPGPDKLTSNPPPASSQPKSSAGGFLDALAGLWGKSTAKIEGVGNRI